MFDVLDQLLVFLRIESNAGSISTGSGGSARSMDVCLDVLGRLNLDYEIYVGDIETSGSDVSGNKDVKLTLLEALKGYFSLILSDVTVHDLNVLFDFVGEKKLVSLCFGGAEDNGLADASIANEDVGQSTDSVLPRTIYC